MSPPAELATDSASLGADAGAEAKSKLAERHTAPPLSAFVRFFSRLKTESLHFHASNGNKEELLRLLEAGAHVDSPGLRGKTPLMVACINRHNECAVLLLNYGANVLLCTSDRSRTCLHYAAKGGDVGCIRAVLRFAKEQAVETSWGFSNFVNWRDKAGASALHLAVRGQRVECVRMLLREGAHVCLNDTQNRQSPIGSYPLHWAAAAGDAAVAKELLLWGAEKNLRDRNSLRAYDIALRYGHTECARLLGPRAEQPLCWPTPWEHILPVPGSALRALLDRALVAASGQLPASAELQGGCSKARAGARGGHCTGDRRAGEGAPQDSATEQGSGGSSEAETGGSRALGEEDPSAGQGRGESLSLPKRLLQSSQSLLHTMCLLPEASRAAPPHHNRVAPELAHAREDPETSGMGEGDSTPGKDSTTCTICWARECEMVAVLPCRHEMCSLCLLTLCCHCKPKKTYPYSNAPACPFCRTSVSALASTAEANERQ